MAHANQAPVERALQLPFDFHRTPGTQNKPASHAFDLALPAGAEDALLAAAFGVLLHRYNAQASIFLNASRGAARWRRTLELSTAPGTRFKDVLEQARRELLRVDAAADDGGAEGSRATIVFSESAADAPGLVEGSTLESCGDDLRLVVARSKTDARAVFLYNASLFRKTSVERFAGHLRELLAGAALDPEAPIATLPLLPPTERRWIESVCTGPDRASAPELVHVSFERRAAEKPEATAARFRDRSLSYGRLNALANRLARGFAARGVGAGSRVVVFLEPSLEVPAALLAVLKAGAVYVPLDPGYPPARVRVCLEDVQPARILTREGLRERFPADGAPIMTLDLESRWPEGPDADLGLALEPAGAAYVYFTSGTTGKPKGAVASRANLASYIAGARERYGIGSSDVMPAIARFSFSISMFELMSPLAAGGTLVVLERDHVLDLDRMAKTLEEATIFHAGPSLLKNLLPHIKRRYPDFSPFSRVRHASSGGDMVPPETLEALKTIFANAEVFVIYGCSEISCMGCTYPAPRERAVERTYVGRPFEGMRVRVLDAAYNMLPVGVVGEIHFAGDGIVDGYLNRPELTAEKFVELDGRRWYRTGDMGRLSEDGWLEILGRSDFQVKLRGMRIELGEIEHNLRGAAGVRDGVVTTRSTPDGELSLVAYIVMDHSGKPPAGPPLAEIQRHMMEHLPDYMVPAAYVELDSLPLNHNMKVDRRALPAPGDASIRLKPEAAPREPRTPTEKRLAALWSKLLGLERVGLDDHFFDLGGHSVLGLTLILDVESALGVVLSGLEVLRESLEGQAAICDRRLGKPAPAPAPAAAGPDEDSEGVHFGEGLGLYGVLAGLRGARGGDAVLICPPLGQEHLRAHFILRRLAERLAAAGVPSLRFDWYGCGDSMGESADADCARWRRDAVAALRELEKRTGASRITAVGVRAGATLLAGASDGLGLAGLVLWDPVCDGAQHCAELAETHERFTRGWRSLLRGPRPSAPGATELVGLSCSRTCLEQLRALRLPAGLSRPGRPVKWLETTRDAVPEPLARAAGLDRHGSRAATLPFAPGWNDIARLGHLLPDVGVSAKLAELAMERT